MGEAHREIPLGDAQKNLIVLALGLQHPWYI